MNVCASCALVEGGFKRRQQLNAIRRCCFFTDGDALLWKALIFNGTSCFFKDGVTFTEGGFDHIFDIIDAHMLGLVSTTAPLILGNSVPPIWSGVSLNIKVHDVCSPSPSGV